MGYEKFAFLSGRTISEASRMTG